MKETFIQNAPLFSSLTPDEQHIIGSAMKEMAFAKGETLLAQGQPAQRMYLIQSGWVKQVTTIEGGRTLVNNLGAGSLVGDMDVLLDQPAAGTAQTNSNVLLWSLSQANLSRILDENPRIGLKLSAATGSRIQQVDRYLINTRLRAMGLFADLEADQLAALAGKLQPLEVRRGGLIFRAGAPGDAMFIIEEGEVLLASALEDAGEPYRQLGPGETLGEMAVVAGKSYDSMARASTEAVLWVLRREDFVAVVTRFPNVRVAISGRLSQPLGMDDRKAAQKQLTKLPLFADLPADALGAVASVLVLRHYPTAERVFAIGDPGDALIVVDSGQLKLTDADGASRALRAGESYGDSSLLTGKSRADYAVAESDSNLWILYKSDFEALLARYPSLGTALGRAVTAYLHDTDRLFLDSHLRGIALFAGLSDAELRDIAGALRPLQLKRGETIFADGQRGDAMYFIETGEVQLATRAGDSYQMSFERLGAGAFFGELALLADNPRKSTARAVGNDTQLWTLDKADFDRLVVKHPQLALTLSKVLGERLARADSRPVAPRAQIGGRSPGRPGRAAATGAAVAAAGARPLVARPSSVPIVKRPTTGGTKPTTMQATPLTVKPATGVRFQPGAPQARPVAARPAQPLVAPRVAGRQQMQAVATRPASRAVAVAPQSDPLTLALVSGVNWMLARSLGFKFRLAALTMMFVWLCGIAAPVTVISALAASGKSAPAAIAGVAVNISSNDTNPLPAQVALAATFTPTPLPTSTPTPMPTPTEAPATDVPTATPLPASPTPRPTRAATPTPAPAGPVAAEAPAPALPTVDYKVDSVRRLTACENNGNHNLFILVLDQNGNGVPGLDMQVAWDGGRTIVGTGNKVENIPALGLDAKTTKGYVDFAMYHGKYKVKVLNAQSEETDWLTVDIPMAERCDRNGNDIGNSLYHYSYLIVFRKVR